MESSNEKIEVLDKLHFFIGVRGGQKGSKKCGTGATIEFGFPPFAESLAAEAL